MSIQNKSVYKTYQRALADIDDQDSKCPVCGKVWENCSHYNKELIAYGTACNKHIQHLELRVAEAETTAMVLGRQNYELRQALKSSQDARKYYNNVAVELARILHDKRYDLTNEK